MELLVLAWIVLSVPLGMLVGRLLRERQPPVPDVTIPLPILRIV